MTELQNSSSILSLATLSHSPKKEGRFEKDIIPKVASFFRLKNYETKEHISLNLAWGKVISEIDLVAANQNEVIIVEVKSKRDKISRARKQLDNVRIFSDYCFIASDTIVNQNQLASDTGILFLNKDEIISIRQPKKINDSVTKDFLLKLKKTDLDLLCKTLAVKKFQEKSTIADFLVNTIEPRILKKHVRSIVWRHA